MDFKWIARSLGLSRPEGQEHPQTPGGADAESGYTSSGQPQGPGTSTYRPPKLGPYSEFLEDLRHYLIEFTEQRVAPHIALEEDEVFSLVEIVVETDSPERKTIVERYLSEFKPVSRRKTLHKLIGEACGSVIQLDHFRNIALDKPDSVEAASADPFRRYLDEVNSASAFRFILFGDFVPKAAIPHRQSPAAAAAAAPAYESSWLVAINVADADGTRSAEFARLPIQMGRDCQPPHLRLNGKWVSRLHGQIHEDPAGALVFKDQSSNGSTLDGVFIRAGGSTTLRDGCQLILGRADDAPADSPRLSLRITNRSMGQHSTTPIRPSSAAAKTPLRADGAISPAVTTPREAQRVLALLSVQDHQGSRTVPVESLPFDIGRATEAHCRIAEANAGVSRQHLTILAIDHAGATVHNHAGHPDRWGTSVDGQEQPSEFVLPWQGTAVLAPRYAQAQSAKIQLLTTGR